MERDERDAGPRSGDRGAISGRYTAAADDRSRLGEPDSNRSGGALSGVGDAEEQPGGAAADHASEVLAGAGHSPLFHAQHELRYIRQALIETYERAFNCRLVVINDAIFGYSITLSEELLHDALPDTDLHVVLNTPGGDGEVAVRLARSMQSRCRELTVVIPDVAKSAGTLLALGAHRILMGPASDLGPVDPQMQLKPGMLVSAKDIIASVEDAARRVQELPQTYPIYASLLTDVTAITVQQARSALARTSDQLMEALKSNPDRSDEDAEALRTNLQAALVEARSTHAAIFGAREAIAAGLPVTEADLDGRQWRLLWRLWTAYFHLGQRIYESRRTSQIIGSWQGLS